MKDRLTLRNRFMICLLLVTVIGGLRLVPWLYAAYRLPRVAASDMGLVWQECELTAADADMPNHELVERCFGHPWEPFSDAERATHAVVANGQWSLAIGNNVYTIIDHQFAMSSWPRLYFWHLLGLRGRTTFYKNGQAIKTLYSSFQPYSPSLSLQQIAGKAVWEFADRWTTTIMADDQDLRRTGLVSTKPIDPIAWRIS